MVAAKGGGGHSGMCKAHLAPFRGNREGVRVTAKAGLLGKTGLHQDLSITPPTPADPTDTLWRRYIFFAGVIAGREHLMGTAPPLHVSALAIAGPPSGLAMAKAGGVLRWRLERPASFTSL